MRGALRASGPGATWPAAAERLRSYSQLFSSGGPVGNRLGPARRLPERRARLHLPGPLLHARASGGCSHGLAAGLCALVRRVPPGLARVLGLEKRRTQVAGCLPSPAGLRLAAFAPGGHVLGRHSVHSRAILRVAAGEDADRCACLDGNGNGKNQRQQEPQDVHQGNLRFSRGPACRTGLTLSRPRHIRFGGHPSTRLDAGGACPFPRHARRLPPSLRIAWPIACSSLPPPTRVKR